MNILADATKMVWEIGDNSHILGADSSRDLQAFDFVEGWWKPHYISIASHDNTTSLHLHFQDPLITCNKHTVEGMGYLPSRGKNSFL